MRPTLSVRSYPPFETVHAHGWHQIVLAVDGTLSMTVGPAADGIAGEIAGAVDDEAFVIVAANRPHRFRGEHDNRFVVLDVPPAAGFAALPDQLVERLPDSPFLVVDEGMRHLLRYIAHDAQRSAQRSTGGADLCDQLAPLLLHALRTRVEERQHWPAPLARALTCLRRESCETLTVERLAAAAAVSVSGLHALFRRWLGVSPGRHLLDHRLDEAENLIVHGRLPLSEVALAVGFSDQSALTRSLRRRRGTTPGALRRTAKRPPSGD